LKSVDGERRRLPPLLSSMSLPAGEESNKEAFK